VRWLAGLVQACHLLPSLAVTAFGTAYGALAVDLPLPTLLVLAAALLVGQLSIGWSNDWVDAPRDTTAGRPDKPIPAGLVPRGVVGVAALAAAATCVGVSLALGVVPGLVHLVAVASAWAYNARLKSTPASPVPYVVSFALLPAVASTAASPGQWPHVTVLVAGAALGVAAHFANTVGDGEADALTGVRGLPQRLGPRRSMIAMAVFVLFAAAALPIGPQRPGMGGTVVLIAGALLATAAAAVTLRGGPGKGAFRITLIAVAMVVGGFLASGQP